MVASEPCSLFATYCVFVLCVVFFAFVSFDLKPVVLACSLMLLLLMLLIRLLTVCLLLLADVFGFSLVVVIVFVVWCC